ncbi:GNAT family N-acetyltransferase [Catenulispora subtropica]
MTIEIRELDPVLPETQETLLPLFQAASAADMPRHPEPTAGFLRFITGPRVARHRLCVTAFDGGAPIAFGCLNQDLAANPDMIFGDIWILPERRAEAAVALLDAFKAHTRRRGAQRMVLGFSEFAAPDYEPVFAAAGGRRVSWERRSQLDLTTIDREQYAAWAAPSPKNARYRIQAWTVPTPEHLLAPLVEANDAIRDAPTGDLRLNHAPPDVERRRAAETLIVAAGVRKHIIAALTEDGEMAGMHEMFVVPGFRMGDVGNTAVPAKFRGHGLGLRLKADLALRLLASEPELDVVSTWNDAGNGPMLRVNEAMGYEKAEAWSNWQFDL